MQKNSFEEFLDNKTLFYDKIDYDVIYKSWNILSNHVNLPYVIHLVGTNGKGTTGRFIASFLKQQNKTVLHYTSPHIIEFNERIWLNGSNVSNEALESTHQFFLTIFPNDILEQLTYFEYTTLMALYLSSDLDYLVLEAGLGGEFDATNVVKNNLTVVPSIGMDHMEFLGNTIVDIATTKLKSCDEKYILGLNMPQEVLDLRQSVLVDKQEVTVNTSLQLINSTHLPQYLQNNLLLALSVLEYLNLYDDRLKLDLIEGRFEKIEKNITLDVGHNPLAAGMIARELGDKKVNFVYNSYKDKDYREVLSILKDNIEKLYIIYIEDDRIEDTKVLLNVCKEFNIDVQDTFSLDDINENKEYFVFGSFKVVEAFKNMIKSKYEK